MNLYEKTACELRDLFLKKELKAQEIVDSYLDHIDKTENKLKSFITITRGEALKKAEELDKKLLRGEKVGPLAGVVVAVKDNICTKGVKTTCGSKILGDFIAPYDAFVVERLEQADAIIIGKTNLDEFAMGSSTENSAFYPTRNPWDTSRIPGGSSGGSAAAVSSMQVAVGLGSDTGGSIRQPAFMTGIVGFKPTYGVVSRYGLVAFASSLDQIGPMARDTRDCALLLDVISGKDYADSTSVALSHNNERLGRHGAKSAHFLSQLDAKIEGMRVGVPKEFLSEAVEPDILGHVENCIRLFEKLGCKIVEVSLPMAKYGIAAYYIIAPSEASSNLARYDGVHYGYRSTKYNDVISLYSKSRKEGFGPEVTRRIMLGTFALSTGYYDAYYLRALKVRRLIKQDFDSAFEKADVLIGPTSPVTAFKLGEKLEDPLQMYLCDIFTVSTNLAGIPAISIPCGFSRAGLPIGLQIQAKAFDDLLCLNVARALEKELAIAPLCPVV